MNTEIVDSWTCYLFFHDDDVFKKFMSQSQGNQAVIINKVFGDGSLFSPLLFGKFFDPSDAFPLWEFECEILLCNLRSSGFTTVDWIRTEHDYVLKAELPGKWFLLKPLIFLSYVS